MVFAPAPISHLSTGSSAGLYSVRPMLNETTQEKRKGEHLVAHQFKAGNPGRPKGSKNKLGEDFVAALADDFAVHGTVAIEQVRAEKPDAYLKVIASIIPKEVHHVVEDLAELTDDELHTRFLAAAAKLNGNGGHAVRAGAQGKPQSLPN